MYKSQEPRVAFLVVPKLAIGAVSPSPIEPTPRSPISSCLAGFLTLASSSDLLASINRLGYTIYVKRSELLRLLRRSKDPAIALILALFAIGCAIRYSPKQNKVPRYASFVAGRINFATGVSPATSTKILIETSEDNFATIKGVLDGPTNDLGLVSFPFHVPINPTPSPIPSPNPTYPPLYYNVRAYQDTNGNRTYDVGEPTGRIDPSVTGNTTYTGVNMVVGTTCPPGFYEVENERCCENQYVSISPYSTSKSDAGHLDECKDDPAKGTADAFAEIFTLGVYDPKNKSEDNGKGIGLEGVDLYLDTAQGQ